LTASDSFTRSESPSPNIGNDSGYGSFNDATPSVRAQSGTPMTFEYSHSPYYSVEESSGGPMLPITRQRAMTAEPLQHNLPYYYANHTDRARSATPAARNVAHMLLNRNQPKQIPRNARAMTAPPVQYSTNPVAPNNLAPGPMFAASPSTFMQQTQASGTCDYDHHHNFSNIDPGLLSDSRQSSPFTSFDSAMDDGALYDSPMTTASMAEGSPYFDCGYTADADVQYMSLEGQAFSTPCFKDYDHSNDVMMADSGFCMNDSAMNEEDAMNMFMNFE